MKDPEMNDTIRDFAREAGFTHCTPSVEAKLIKFASIVANFVKTEIETQAILIQKEQHESAVV